MLTLLVLIAPHFEASQAASLCPPALYLLSICDSDAPLPRAARKFRASVGAPRGYPLRDPRVVAGLPRFATTEVVAGVRVPLGCEPGALWPVSRALRPV